LFINRQKVRQIRRLAIQHPDSFCPIEIHYRVGRLGQGRSLDLNKKSGQRQAFTPFPSSK